jgi:uncharacterized SAM-binding protein YcdF (DUF218 family)
MFLLKKLLSSLILPPGCFIVALLLISLRLRRRATEGGGGAFIAVLALLLWALSIDPVSSALMGGLESGVAPPVHPGGDVIVLLGGGIVEGAPDLTGRSTPTEGMMPRVVTAVRLQRRLGIPILVSGGSVVSGHGSEALVVRRFLMDLGVAENRIILESRSRDTRENARFCREIIGHRGFRQPLLVTSAYHMRRSLLAFGEQGVRVTPVPVQFSRGRVSRHWLDWAPDMSALKQSTAALHEYAGLLFYALSTG